MQQDKLEDMYAHGVCMQIHKGDCQGIDMRPYAKLGYDGNVLKQIRRAMVKGFDIAEYASSGYDGEQLREIRVALKQGLDLSPYLPENYCGAQLRQIRKGIRHYIDVSWYADVKYNWLQMREIRIGLQNRLDVEVYANPFYSCSQMREIRLGLEDGIDVSSYAKLRFSCMDMKVRREELTRQLYTKEKPLKEVAMVDEGSGLPIVLSEDRMEAYMVFPEEEGKLHITTDYVEQILQRNGVVYGIDYESIEQAIKEQRFEERILVAKGLDPQNGESGKYEFFFDMNPSRKPVELEDGRVDYKNVNIFEEVKEGQVLAKYIAPKVGAEGKSVRGIAIPGQKGKDLPMLTGKGFRLLEDGVTYVAEISGIISYNDGNIQIYEVLLIEGDVNAAQGNIEFGGCVHIMGNVGANVEIYAKGSVSVEGTVEAAKIISDEDVLIKNGMVGSGKGYIKAAGSISGNFFEACNLNAGVNISAGYLMNSESVARQKVVTMGRKGAIIGGRTCGVTGVVANHIGNRSQITTEIEVGFSKEVIEKQHDVQQEYEKAKIELSELEQRMERTAEALKQSIVYRKMLAEYMQKQEQVEQLEKRCEKIQQLILADSRVKVLSRAYVGTVITINQVRRRLDEEYKSTSFRLEGQMILNE